MSRKNKFLLASESHLRKEKDPDPKSSVRTLGSGWEYFSKSPDLSNFKRKYEDW
jgi:hypothetical protein